MTWTIPPDSLAASDLMPDDRRAPARRLMGPDIDLGLVEATQAYLACRAAGMMPGPGLRTAWDEFYQTYAPVVRRATSRRRVPAADQADEAQDVWQAVVAGLGSFRPDPTLGSFRGWLLMVAHRRLADRRRAEARRPDPIPWDALLDEMAGSEPDPAEACERVDERAEITALLARLRGEASPLSYRVLHLRSLDGLSIAEVAGIVGLTEAQVRARHHRMLAQLRRLAGANSRNFAPAAQQRPGS